MKSMREAGCLWRLSAVFAFIFATGTADISAQPSAAAAKSTAEFSNKECRELMMVRGQNRAAVNYGRQWLKARDSAESALCLSYALAPMGEIREADSLLKRIDGESLGKLLLGDFYWARSLVADRLGRDKAALEFAKKSVTAYAAVSMKDFEAEARLNYFYLLRDQELTDEAETQYKTATKLCSADWCRAALAVATAALASDVKITLTLLETAYSRYAKIGDELGMAGVSMSIAETHVREESFDEAEKALRRVEKHQKEAGSREIEADLLITRGDILRLRDNDEKKARDHYNRALSLAREIGVNSIAKTALRSLNELE
jgi:tetratricopeptide (TPR) repeat protein